MEPRVSAPYPADTRAKGWRFELDYEQIEQSDTWGAAKPDARPWLLLLWVTAWKQVPCGSLPADDEVIVGKLGITDEVWAVHRRALMRGWWLADDGRLYHDTLVVRVREMMARRRSDADRQALRRTRSRAVESEEVTETHADVTRDTAVSHAGVHCESSTDNRIPTRDISKPSVSHPKPIGSGKIGGADGFDVFWQAYPRKAGKVAALKAFSKIKPDAALLAEMLSAVKQQKESAEWSRGDVRYIPHPATWLNGGRWEDEVQRAMSDGSVPDRRTRQLATAAALTGEMFKTGHYCEALDVESRIIAS